MASSSDDKDLRRVSDDADQLLADLDEFGVEATAVAGGAEVPEGDPKNIRMRSVSNEMRVRLASIDKLIAEGFHIEMVWDAFPQLISSNGSVKSVWTSSPAGFSWIAFFFPYAVCAQIREWSYFYVIGCAFLAGSIFYKISGWDPAIAISVGSSSLYGYTYPFLRWSALRKSKSELDVGPSIAVGLVLSLLAVIPSIIFESIFI